MSFEIRENVLVKYTGNDSVVNIPEGVGIIGEQAFKKNQAITKVVFSPAVRMIRENAFEKCNNLAEIELNDGLLRIDKCAFDHCKSLNNVRIPDTVTHIGGWAFDGCASLTACEVSSAIRSCDETVFKGCPFYTQRVASEINEVVENNRSVPVSEDNTYSAIRRQLEEQNKAQQQAAYRETVEKQLQYLKDIGDEGYWQYHVVNILDKNGCVDVDNLIETLNSMGRNGWHLVSAYSNEVGKNSLSVAGIGVNSSVDQNILIFERFVRF